MEIMGLSFNQRTKTIVSVALLVCFVIFNIANQSTKIEPTLRRELSTDSSFTYRYLSKNLGDGRCEWTPPEFLKTLNREKTTTVIASYPGSGKRLVWRIIEAMTGKRTGDDWNLSRNGFDRVLTLKTSYPHPDGAWHWSDVMDQMILIVRNPRYAIPSYHNMRHELAYSTKWEESARRIEMVYTRRPHVYLWNKWRNAKWYKELNRWCYHLDFWMNGGLHRVKRDTYAYDFHCRNSRHLDCTPKAVIQFEALYAEGETGVTEALKLASALDGLDETSIIAEEARPCVYREVMKRPEFFNRNRDGNGPPMELFLFHYTQLDLIRQRLLKYRDKYSSGKWVGNKNAEALSKMFDTYYNEVNEEYEVAAADYYEKRGFIYELTDFYNMNH